MSAGLGSRTLGRLRRNYRGNALTKCDGGVLALFSITTLLVYYVEWFKLEIIKLFKIKQ